MTNPDIKDNDYYTAEEAAKFLRVSLQTVKNYFKTGRLVGTKRGSRKQWHALGKDIKRKMKEFGFLQ